MSQQSITVNIGGRVYPLTVSPEEEQSIRNAAKRVNDNIQHLQDEYAVQDMKDLLAMTALQMATQYEKKEVGEHEENARLGEELEDLDQRLRTYLGRDED